MSRVARSLQSRGFRVVPVNGELGPIDLLAFKHNQARAIHVSEFAMSDETQGELTALQHEFSWFNVLAYVVSPGTKKALVFCTDSTKPYRATEELSE